MSRRRWLEFMETRETKETLTHESRPDGSQEPIINPGGVIMLTPEELERMLRSAGREGAKHGIEAYQRAEEKAKEERAEKVRNSAKTIIIHYRQLKKMHKTSVVNAETVTDPTLREILEGLAGRIRRDEFSLNSTSRNKIITGMLMNHVDVQLENYRKECKRSKVPDVQRRYRIVEEMFLREDPLKAEEVAEAEFIDKSSVYRTLERAYDDLAVLFFGLEGVNGIEVRREKRKRERRGRTGSQTQTRDATITQ